MKKGNSEILTDAQRAELMALEAMPDSTIDVSDIPPTTDFSGARRGVFFRPVKQALSIRIDADIVRWFRESGTGYQTLMNAALREYMSQKSKKPFILAPQNTVSVSPGSWITGSAATGASGSTAIARRSDLLEIEQSAA